MSRKAVSRGLVAPVLCLVLLSCNDSTTPQAPDSGVDQGPGVDGSSHLDRGPGSDQGGAADGTLKDATLKDATLKDGTLADSGGPLSDGIPDGTLDAGAGGDGLTAADSGGPGDAAAAPDSGTLPDQGPALDQAAPADAAPLPDAGSPLEGGVQPADQGFPGAEGSMTPDQWPAIPDLPLPDVALDSLVPGDAPGAEGPPLAPDAQQAPDGATQVDAPGPAQDSGVFWDSVYNADQYIPQWDGAFLGDQPPPGDTFAGVSDAGKYLCWASAGVKVVCQCDDGLDNDNDGWTDYPADSGCLGPWDNTEALGTTQCTDGKDNDNDGFIDAADPDCTGPLDNDESSYGTGIPGDNKDPCKQDCFFDGNSGQGDDKCEWNLKCDPKNPGYYIAKQCIYDPTFKNCPATQSATCLQKCLPITPNGCDCFGCCQLSYGGVTATVMLLASCTPALLSDPTKCVPCTQVPSCLNPCGPCEVCIGKPNPEPWCFPGKDAGTPGSDSGAPASDGAYPPGDGAAPGTEGGIPVKDGSVTPGDGSPPAKDGAQDKGYKIPDGGIPSPCPGGLIYCGPGGINPNQCPTGTYCITGCCVALEF